MQSSEDVEAQAKSFPDQIADYEEYALRHNLKVVGKQIQESKSAKKSGNQPLFTQMLKDIESGKFNGIIAWHPDRLARNILEAGMIVDMVDNDAIKGLQFPTHPFMDNASEKLNLNIQFALSKQQECSKKSRAVPIKIILEEIYKTLGELKFDERDYNRHLKDLKEYVDIKLDKLIVEKRSLLDTKRRKQAKINEYVLEQQMEARNPVVKTFWREKYY